MDRRPDELVQISQRAAKIAVLCIEKANVHVASPAHLMASQEIQEALTAAARERSLAVLRFVASDPCFSSLGSVTQEDVLAAIDTAPAQARKG